MKGNIARYFTANRLASWPLWKTLVSGVLAVAIAGSGTGAAVAAVSAAAATPAPTAAATAAPTQEPTPTPVKMDASWLSLKWDATDIVGPAMRATNAQVSMEVNVSQQKIGLDLYETNSVTGKKSAFSGAAVTVTLTCVSLTEVEDKENLYDSEAGKEGAVTTYPMAKGTASLLIDKLNPGKYTLSVSSDDKSFIMPAAQNVTVKEKVAYKKTDTKAQAQTEATKQEDQKPTNTGGETVTLAPTKNTKAYIVAVTDSKYLWTSGGSYYLYYANGTKSPYKVTLGSGSDASGNAVTYLKSAAYDAAAAAALATPTPAPSVSPSPSPSISPSPSPSASPSLSPSPTTEPSASPSPSPSAEPSASPSPSPEQPSASPDAAAGAPTAVLAAAVPQLLTKYASVSAQSSVAAATAAPVASYELFSEANGAAVENTVFLLPAASALILGASNAAGSGQVQGIDISYHQGTIDFNAVKAAGVDFVIIRVGYRGYESGKIVADPKFDTYIQGAKAAGLRVGVYFFSQAINAEEGVEEASAALNAVSKYGLDYPIFIDSEYSSGAKTGRADGISQAARTEAVVAFCETVRNSGYRAGIYASTYWYRTQLNFATVSQYTVWNAHYGVSASDIPCALWQYTSKGSVSGISTSVDLNISYIG